MAKKRKVVTVVTTVDCDGNITVMYRSGKLTSEQKKALVDEFLVPMGDGSMGFAEIDESQRASYDANGCWVRCE